MRREFSSEADSEETLRKPGNICNRSTKSGVAIIRRSHTMPQIKKSWMKPSQVVTMIFDDPKVWFDFSYLQKFIKMGKF